MKEKGAADELLSVCRDEIMTVEWGVELETRVYEG